jgi:ureidoglycolate lyase
VTALERHLFSAQCFVPMAGGRLLLVVVLADGHGQPVVASVGAFLAMSGQAFEYRPGVWHAGLAALDAPGVVASLLCRDGTTADVEVLALAKPLRVALA